MRNKATIFLTIVLTYLLLMLDFKESISIQSFLIEHKIRIVNQPTALDYLLCPWPKVLSISKVDGAVFKWNAYYFHPIMLIIVHWIINELRLEKIESSMLPNITDFVCYPYLWGSYFNATSLKSEIENPEKVLSTSNCLVLGFL